MKHTKKLFALMLCLIMALSMMLSVSASDAAEDQTEVEIEWEISEDQQTVRYGDKVYTRYALPYYDWFRPYHFYRYSQYVNTDDPMVDSIGHPMVFEADGQEPLVYEDMVIIFDVISVYSEYRVYVTEQGAEKLDAYTSGNYAQYELTYGTFEGAVISEETVRAWNTSDATDKAQAAQLGEMMSYKVIGYDSTLTFAHVIGQVFENNGTYLYVNYSMLDNSYFDANGDLSFRQGEVPVVQLDQASESIVTDAIGNMEYYSVNIEEEQSDPLDATLSMILFLILASPFMYLFPILLLILGIVMRCIKKLPGRKRWNAVIIAAIVWLGLAIIASCILVIPTIFIQNILL